MKFNRPPALYSANRKSEFIAELKQCQLTGTEFIKFCDILSLSSAQHVMPILTWYDVGCKLLAFVIRSPISYLVDESFLSETEEFTEKMLNKTKLYVPSREKITNNQPNQATALDISIRKWIDSKRSNMSISLNDRCVDMRTALEGLFQSMGEIRKNFGIGKQNAFLCSCLLDYKPIERVECFLTLITFYDLSSKIVHASIDINARILNAIGC